MSATTSSRPITADTLIRHYDLQPHPEGGYFIETYRSTGIIPAAALPPTFSGALPYASSIFYLLEEGDMSCLHRIRQDELWHFYLGDPMRLLMISPDGVFSEVLLGQDVLNGQHLHYTVPAGYWFGATPASGSAFCLLGCTVAPVFSFADFEMGYTEPLLALFPHLGRIITQFTRSDPSL